jgi:alkylation response protein AidB-like acyl-CoA dehydrogenase
LTGFETDIALILSQHSDPSLGYKGITAFVVEKEWGIEVAKKEQKVSRTYKDGGR